jgi:hypothetical protein
VVGRRVNDTSLIITYAKLSLSLLSWQLQHRDSTSPPAEL